MRRDMRNAWQIPLATHPRFVYFFTAHQAGNACSNAMRKELS